MNNALKNIDSKIYNLIKKEEERQHNHIELIASENIVDTAVMEAVGSALTNKYAEGYSGKRYYGGCEIIDMIETEAIERAKKLFNCKFANVQPHSGSNANAAAYMALLKSNAKIMAMSLSEGGHLTHGSPVNFSGQLYKIISYGVSKDTGLIDYNEVQKLARRHKPNLIVAGATAYSRIIDFKKFREIADEVGAYLMVDMAHFAGLVAADIYPTPLEYADIVTSTTHKTLRGPRGGLLLAQDEKIAQNMNKAVFPGLQGGPLMHIIAGKAVAFKLAMTQQFKNYQKQIVKNAQALAQALADLNFTIITGGTDTHLFLVDLTNKKITGKQFEQALDLAGITVNKNTIPFDKQSPFVTSGIRIGTPAITTRGMKDQDMQIIAELISAVADNIDNIRKLRILKQKTIKFLKQFPIKAF
ncbi:MAG TPA: serine hydroxymethyltransferase [bacterium]|nr:serine hydroxymethyltransferase [bacterium]